MRRAILFIYIIIFIVGLVGCRTPRQTTTEGNYSSHENTTVVYRDSIHYKRDTIKVIEYRIQEDKYESNTETQMQEWWDNWTRTWIDSLGNTVTESHETGNRQTNIKELESRISRLQDSLQTFKTMVDYYCLMDSMRVYMKNDTISSKTVVEPAKKSKWSTFSILYTIVGLILFMVIYTYVWFVILKSKK